MQNVSPLMETTGSNILKMTINNYLLHFLPITITMTMVFSFLLRFFKIIFLTSYLYLYWEPFFKVTRRSLCELGFRDFLVERFWPLSLQGLIFRTLFPLYTWLQVYHKFLCSTCIHSKFCFKFHFKKNIYFKFQVLCIKWQHSSYGPSPSTT